MARLAVLCLMATAALAAEWTETERKFAAAYKAAPDAKARGAALRELAKADVPQAAEKLLAVWEVLAKRKAKLDGEYDKTGKRIRELERKRRKAKPDARQRFDVSIAALREKRNETSSQLGAIDRERYAMLAGLRQMKSAAVREWCAVHGLARAKEPVLLRAVAVQGARVQPDTVAAALPSAKTAARAVPLLQALAHPSAQPPASADGLARVIDMVGHKDAAVRVAAAQALARAAKPRGVEALVLALPKEAPRSHAQREMVRALTRLTGAKLGPYPDAWLRWWTDHKSSVLAGKRDLGKGEAVVGGKKPAQGHFYGIKQDVDRIIYVLDQSGSMEVSMDNPRWEGNSPVPAYDDEDSRFDAAVRELLRASGKLRRGSSFAVILYSDYASRLHDKMVPASKDEHAKLRNALAREGPSGSTNIREALDVALRMANVHRGQTRGEQRADAIILVSDGTPTDAKGKLVDPELVLQAVREWNAMRRVAIHCVGIGAQHAAGFLKKLAAENGGTYYPVFPKKR
ncbi:MAG: vWA domain-containing protein [Planctomycetota bacterium]